MHIDWDQLFVQALFTFEILPKTHDVGVGPDVIKDHESPDRHALIEIVHGVLIRVIEVSIYAQHSDRPRRLLFREASAGRVSLNKPTWNTT